MGEPAFELPTTLTPEAMTECRDAIAEYEAEGYVSFETFHYLELALDALERAETHLVAITTVKGGPGEGGLPLARRIATEGLRRIREEER